MLRRKEGDGNRIIRCWGIFLLQLDTLSMLLKRYTKMQPQLAHQLMWNHFVNTCGGSGHTYITSHAIYILIM